MGRRFQEINRDIVRDPDKLERHLRRVAETLEQVETVAKDAKTAATTPSSSAPDLESLRQSLQAGGSHPLNLEGLIGGESTLPIVTTLPPADNYRPGTLVILESGGNHLYYRNGSNPPSWNLLV